MSLRVICRRLSHPWMSWPAVLRRHSHSNAANEWSRHSKTQRVVSMLSEFDLTAKQTQSIVDRIGKYIVTESDLNEDVMRETMDCWRSHLNPPYLRPNQLDRVNAEDVDFDMSVDFNYVVSQIEPKLLLMNTNAIDFRIKCLMDLGIMSGSRDLWRVFVYAPNGYYLQTWSDFLKKYHYLNYRVLEWLLEKKDRQTLHPHPLVYSSKVMELTFDEIQCRFLFAQRTGLKTISVTNKLSKAKDMNRLDLKTLLLTPIDKYMRQIAPNCSLEEYSALETLLSESPPEEDEQLIEDIVQLSAKPRNFKKNRSKAIINEDMENDFQIITRND